MPRHGPVILSGSVVGARVFERRLSSRPGAGMRVALLLGATYLVAGVIMSLSNSGQMALTVALLGSASILALDSSGQCMP